MNGSLGQIFGAVGILAALIATMFALNSGSSAEVNLLRHDLYQTKTEIARFRDTIDKSYQDTQNFMGRTTEQVERIDQQLGHLREADEELARIDQQVSQLKATDVEQVKRIDEQLSRLAKVDEELDEDLQREMRDLIATVMTEVKGVDTRFQGELRHTTSLLQSTINTLTQSVDDNDAREATNRENVARITEQIRQLEMQIRSITQTKEQVNQMKSLIDQETKRPQP